MTRATFLFSMLTLAVTATFAPGCNDSAVESDGINYCLQQEYFEWFTQCETADDCCLGEDPLCQVMPDLGDQKVCTRECTTAPEDEPIENQCCITSQDHNCGTGCCMVNYIEPDGGESNAGYGVGTCVPTED